MEAKGQRKEQQTLIEVEPQIKSKPIDYVTYSDFIILFIAIGLRFLVVINNKIIELETKKRKFTFRGYFDRKHIIRWVLHVLSAIIGLLTLPQLFEKYILPKYFEGLDDWTLFGSGVVGFLGYDIVRAIEKITLKFMSSKGVERGK